VWNERSSPIRSFAWTYQANPKNKVDFTWYNKTYWFLPDSASATLAFEAATRRDYLAQRLIMADWTMPAGTNRLLSRSQAMNYKSESNDVPWTDLAPGMIRLSRKQSRIALPRGKDEFRNIYQRVLPLPRGDVITSRAHTHSRSASPTRLGASEFVGYDTSPRQLPLEQCAFRIRSRSGRWGSWKADVDQTWGSCADRLAMGRLTLNICGPLRDYF
jgi:hypothetical protein